jgi:hypothetical protein
MPPGEFKNVNVVVREDGVERLWTIDVDPTALLSTLLPELLQALRIASEPDDWTLTVEGSLAQPLLVLARAARTLVKNPTPVTP